MLIAGLVVALLCLLILLGMPVLVSLAASVAVYLAVSGGWALSLPQQIIGGMNDFVLLALPLFILAGYIMNAGGITRRLVEFAIALVGFMRGGLAHVNVATSVMFGGDNLDVLYVTSMARVSHPAVHDMFAVEARPQFLAGGLFAVTGLGIRGIPEPRFAG